MAVLMVATLLVGACAGGGPAGTTTLVTAAEDATTTRPPITAPDYGPAPVVPEGELDVTVVEDLDIVFADLTTGFDFAAVRRLGASGDPRVAWLFADLLRFLPRGEAADVLVGAFEELTGSSITEPAIWRATTDRLLVWDIPAPPRWRGST